MSKMAVVSLGYTSLLLPTESAIQLFLLLQDARIVDTDYKGGFKYAKEQTPRVTLNHASEVDIAKATLEE